MIDYGRTIASWSVKYILILEWVYNTASFSCGGSMTHIIVPQTGSGSSGPRSGSTTGGKMQQFSSHSHSKFVTQLLKESRLRVTVPLVFYLACSSLTWWWYSLSLVSQVKHMVGSSNEDQNNIGGEHTHCLPVWPIGRGYGAMDSRRGEVSATSRNISSQLTHTVYFVVEQVTAVGSSEGIRRAPLSRGQVTTSSSHSCHDVTKVCSSISHHPLHLCHHSVTNSRWLSLWAICPSIGVRKGRHNVLMRFITFEQLLIFIDGLMRMCSS